MPTHILHDNARVKQSSLAISAMRHAGSRIQINEDGTLSARKRKSPVTKYNHELILNQHTNELGVVVIPAELPKKQRDAMRVYLVSSGFKNVGKNAYQKPNEIN